jgi:hypothetical protein
MTPSTSTTTTTSTSVTARRSIIRPRPTGSSSIVSVMAEPPLPEEVVVAIHSPYSLLPNQDGENESIDSSVSGSSQETTDSKEEDSHGSTTSSCPQSPRRPRSIFGSYWQAEGGDSPATRTKMVVPPSRALSPKSVMAPPNSSAMYDFKDLLRYGLDIPTEEDGHDDDMSVNTYERMLKDCEQPAAPPLLSSARLLSPYHNEPLWTSWFGGTYHRHSEPSLRHYPQGRRISRSRQTQSDSALLPSPMGSALRRGRFSSSSHMGETPASTTSTTTTPCPQKDAAAPQPRRQVRFQARIQVHSYQPPVESWAAEGWSQWFGI